MQGCPIEAFQRQDYTVEVTVQGAKGLRDAVAWKER